MRTSITGIIAVAAVAAALGIAPAALASNGNAYGHYKEKHAEKWAKFDERMQKHFEMLIARFEARLEKLRMLHGQRGASGNSTMVAVETEDAEVLDDDSALFKGSVEISGSTSARVWFQYGMRENALTRTTIPVKLTEEGDFERTVNNLRDDVTYFYRAVAQDSKGRRDYGSVESVRTNDDDEDDEDDTDDADAPEASTDAADDVENDSAELSGEIDMNGFEDGRVFFIWGQDKELVEDAEDFDSFDEIDEEGDDLQKEVADDNVDGTETVTLDVDDLEEGETYYFAIGVEYQDGADEKIVIGSVKSFTTED